MFNEIMQGEENNQGEEVTSKIRKNG